MVPTVNGNPGESWRSSPMRVPVTREWRRGPDRGHRTNNTSAPQVGLLGQCDRPLKDTDLRSGCAFGRPLDLAAPGGEAGTQLLPFIA